METRRLGSTTLDITTIGFGTWAAGGGGWRARISTEQVQPPILL